MCKQKVGRSATSWAVIFASMLTLLAGCIPQAARDHARFLAALTEKVKAEGEQFAESRQEIDKARQRNMDILEANALEAEQAAAHALLVWRIAKTDRQSEIYSQVRDAADSLLQGPSGSDGTARAPSERSGGSANGGADPLG
jgi:hypothetical protein